MSSAPDPEWLRRWTGPFTEELVRTPGAFGLGQVPARLAPDAVASSICGFCSTGCGLTLHLRDGRAVNLTPDPSHPVNLGMACPKGWEALAPLDSPDRATTPLRRDRRTGRAIPVDWATAAGEFTRRFRAIQRAHGPHSIAYLSTGQIPTEEMALLGALFKFGMGGLHCDSNTRQCMATAHVAYKQSFGFDAPPFTYADFEESDCLVFVGANPCIAHPIMWQRVLRNRHQPDIIVIDPRRTETAMNATLHLPLAPKSDLVLLLGLARALVERGAVDRGFIDRHTSGWEAFHAFVQDFPPERVCAATGLARTDFDRCADLIATRKRVSFWWTMGVNQGHESTRTAQAIINLALLTGHIGRPGTGANSITGQCNAMGSRLFSNVTSLLGGRDFADAGHRSDVAGILGIPEERIPSEPSWSYDRIVEGIARGEIRGLWVVATNPVHSWIRQDRFRDLLGRLDYLVVQDMYRNTATAEHADLILPAAGWGEKDGTFINSERRIGVIRAVRRAPGLALSDFRIFRLLAEAWGCAPMFRDWNSPEAVFHILRRLSAGRPCDFTGIRDYAHVEAEGGIQWPHRTGDPESPERERRLFADGRFPTPDGRARFLFDPPRDAPEPADAAYPFTLLTGRGTSAQWHTNTRTGCSAVLRRLHPEDCHVEVHPDDAAAAGLASGDAARIESRRGAIEARVSVSPTVARGQLFIAMHHEPLNRLLLEVFDSHSRQPSYKHCAVRIGPADAPPDRPVTRRG